MPVTEPAEESHPVIDVVVAGDVSIDWNLAHVRNVESAVQTAREETDEASACACPGGSMLIGTVVEAVARSLDGRAPCPVRVHREPDPKPRPDDPRYRHYFQTWRRYPASGTDGPATVWRVEEFLGASPRRSKRADAGEAHGSGRLPSDAGDPAAALVILNDDAGPTQGDARKGAAAGDPGAFRFDREVWPPALKRPSHEPWVIVKMRGPVAEGELWRHLYECHARKTIVVMDIRDLRHTSAQVSQKLSWERSAEDLTWELLHNPRLNTLSRAAHVVVSFGPSGVFLMSDTENRPPADEMVSKQCRLYFDPSVVEGEWEQRHTGKMLAKTTVLVAAIARQVMCSPQRPDMAKAIRSGLAAMRTLYRVGYERDESDGTLRFPVGPVVRALEHPHAAGLAAATVPVPTLNPHSGIRPDQPPATTWTVLSRSHKTDASTLAEQIVRRGPESVLRQVPLGRFGDLVTCDRQEIENLRSVRALIEEYWNRASDTLPLSIAVFGPPGAGKSFGVQQVARSLREEIEEHSFDLSQFSAADALVEALHQVRDWSFGGTIPLVFWEEFDARLASQPLGWLRYFLSPMQNGTFQDGQVTHPIGRAVFVFVGGRAHRWDAFVNDLRAAEGVDAKKPDFVSRLRGYVDVLGPNRAQDRNGKPIPSDHYMVRRALLLRSMLKRDQPDLFRKDEDGEELLEIDEGVLRAFLETPEYKHGARSMEAIIKMSVLTGNRRFEQSCLPSEQQLNLHVDGPEFNRLVGRAALFDHESDVITRTCHNLYVEALQAKDFRLGDYDDDDERLSSTLMAYEALTADAREVSRRIALDALDRLNELGYMVTRAVDDEAPLDLQGDELERLTKVAYTGLREARRQILAEAGKRLGSSFPEWDKLTPQDRAAARGIATKLPHLLAAGGYAEPVADRLVDRRCRYAMRRVEESPAEDTPAQPRRKRAVPARPAAPYPGGPMAAASGPKRST